MKGAGVTDGHLPTSFCIRILSMIAYCFLTVTLEEQGSSLSKFLSTAYIVFKCLLKLSQIPCHCLVNETENMLIPSYKPFRRKLCTLLEIVYTKLVIILIISQEIVKKLSGSFFDLQPKNT